MSSSSEAVRAYEIGELEDFFSIARPLFTEHEIKKKPESKPANDNSGSGTGEAVDIEQRLEDMRHEAPGNNSIHATQLSVSAALLNVGTPLEDVVDTLLEATMKCAPMGGKWDARQERIKLLNMCATWIVKRAPENPKIADTLSDDVREALKQAIAAGKRVRLHCRANAKEPKLALQVGNEERDAQQREKYEQTAERNRQFREQQEREAAEAAAETELERETLREKFRAQDEAQAQERQQEHEQAQQEKRAPLIETNFRFWMTREIAPEDFLMGNVFSTTNKSMLIAPTGLGKTMLAVAIAMRISLGLPFLHWPAGRPGNVLYYDGEMPRVLFKDRIASEAMRIGKEPINFHAASHEDLRPHNFHPLNDDKGRGQKTFARIVEDIGGIDFAVLDNYMSLLSGSMKEEDSWAEILPWVLALSAQKIGQLWVHHTGLDTSRGYGTKTKEWQLDNVMILEEIKRLDTPVSFKLSFSKARNRRPDTPSLGPGNIEQFSDRHIFLVNDVWRQLELGPTSDKLQPKAEAEVLLRALVKALSGPDVIQIDGKPAVTVSTWIKAAQELGMLPMSGHQAANERKLGKHRAELVACRIIQCKDELTWLIT
jgi:AAA domain